MGPETVHLPYATLFRCIGAECEDTCCAGWSIPLDQAACTRFTQMKDGPLKGHILSHIEPATEATNQLASFRMVSGNRCPLLSQSGWCHLQEQEGESALPHTCRTYPRYVQRLAGELETALALSCPEAARLVLLHPNLFATIAPRLKLERDNTPGLTPLMAWAPFIRAIVFTLVAGHRDYPLWQRLFLLRLFCHRLDGLQKETDERKILKFVGDFEMSVAAGSLRTAINTLPANTEAQLDIVLQLAGLLLHESNIRPRFVKTIEAFTAGIGNGPGATLASLAAGYAHAQNHWLSPMLARHPLMIENWLINAIVRYRFPFGKQSEEQNWSAVSEFESLAADFVLTRGLLAGVAGYHREAFDTQHVIATVQAAAKHFEHHPGFVSKARALVAESRMSDTNGWAILLQDRIALGQQESAQLRPQPPTETVQISHEVEQSL